MSLSIFTIKIHYFFYYLDTSTEQVTGGGLHDSSPEVLHLILSHVFAIDDQIFGMFKYISIIYMYFLL